jgi:hypothetical protein
MSWLSYTTKVVALAACWVIPYGLRQVDPFWEPYPALLFPSGATLAKVGGASVQSGRFELSSVSSDGQEHEIAAREFLSPLPKQFWAGVMNAGFGLYPHPRAETLRLGSWSVRVDGERPPSADRRAQAERWLRERLIAVGRGGDRTLRLRRLKLTLELATTQAGKMSEDVHSEVAWVRDVAL